VGLHGGHRVRVRHATAEAKGACLSSYAQGSWELAFPWSWNEGFDGGCGPQRVEVEEAHARDKAVDALRLRWMLRGDCVSTAQYMHCCRALVEYSASLAPVAHGLSLRVASANVVSDCGTYIDIQHNSLY
jgi:hypothetical protein